MSPYTTPIVVSVSGSNARAEGRDFGGAVIGAVSRASGMSGLLKAPAKNTLPGRPKANEPADSTYHHSGRSRNV